MHAIDDIATPFINDAARDRVAVAGLDAQRYLQSQVAQDIDDLAIGASRWTLVLEPSGKVEALARITRTDETTFELDTDAGFGDALMARLNRFRIRVDAEISVASAEPGHAPANAEDARIAAGWPRMGVEIVPGETIPATTGLLSIAVSVTKGCYPGQELVERMDSRGADAPRLLRLLPAPEGATAGDPILDADDNEVGVYTSVGSEGLALGYVKRGADLGHAPAHAPH